VSEALRGFRSLLRRKHARLMCRQLAACLVQADWSQRALHYVCYCRHSGHVLRPNVLARRALALQLQRRPAAAQHAPARHPLLCSSSISTLHGRLCRAAGGESVALCRAASELCKNTSYDQSSSLCTNLPTHAHTAVGSAEAHAHCRPHRCPRGSHKSAPAFSQPPRTQGGPGCTHGCRKCERGVRALGAGLNPLQFVTIERQALSLHRVTWPEVLLLPGLAQQHHSRSSAPSEVVPCS